MPNVHTSGVSAASKAISGCTAPGQPVVPPLNLARRAEELGMFPQLNHWPLTPTIPVAGRAPEAMVTGARSSQFDFSVTSKLFPRWSDSSSVPTGLLSDGFEDAKCQDLSQFI
ncbi:hypothetical protein DUI87_09521 [Hirundo rustica rustica]|uniref:Uncharacterized protein n=1 Tax=Hirundo rustica rustica TaxID=333673 RepID=A0A3M0KMU2_HIRRU|nr:hypothetical protein DUI87_09521 [Hirundo rustica rustica]